MSNPIIHTNYRLKLGNPLRPYGITCLILAAILGWMAFQSAMSLIEAHPLNTLEDELIAIFDQYDGNWAAGVALGFELLYTVVCVFMAVGFALRGLKDTARMFLPSKVPDDFRKPQVVRESLHERSVLTYRASSIGVLRSLRSLVSEGVDFLPPSTRGMVSSYASAPFNLILPVVLITAVVVLQGRIVEASGFAMAPVSYPVLWVGSLVAIAAFKFFVALTLIPRGAPEVNFLRTRQTLGGAGHPETFLSELETKAEEFMEMEIPNRIYLKDEITLPDVAATGTGSVHGGLMLETQPVPIPQDHHFAGYLTLLAGVVLTPLGLQLLMSLPVPAGAGGMENYLTTALAPQIFHVFAGWAILAAGTSFIRSSRSVLGRLLFKSHVFDVQVSGTFYRGEVGAGMAKTDSLRSTSTAIRSEIVAVHHAAVCVSESVGFGKRELLAARVDETLQEQADGLKEALVDHQNRGASLIGIDLEGNQAIGRLAQANVSLEAAKEQAKIQAGRSEEAPELLGEDQPTLLDDPSESPAQETVAETPEPSYEAGAETKECPDCAELVRARARRCRFCGYVFVREMEVEDG